jgi:hypothetical protein
MEKDEWNDYHKYEVTLENLLENHVTYMKFLEDNFGKEAIPKYYDTKNEMNYQRRIGTGIKLAAKIMKTLSSKKFFDLFIDIMIKQAQYMIPLKCIAGIDYTERKAVMHIEKCLTKRLFRRGIKKFKVQEQISENAFCEYNCIPTFQTYGRIGNIVVSALFKEKGCDIIAELPRNQPLPSYTE